MAGTDHTNLRFPSCAFSYTKAARGRVASGQWADVSRKSNKDFRPGGRVGAKSDPKQAAGRRKTCSDACYYTHYSVAQHATAQPGCNGRNGRYRPSFSAVCVFVRDGKAYRPQKSGILGRARTGRRLPARRTHYPAERRLRPDFGDREQVVGRLDDGIVEVDAKDRSALSIASDMFALDSTRLKSGSQDERRPAPGMR